jgi:hypothetical protein
MFPNHSSDPRVKALARSQGVMMAAEFSRLLNNVGPSNDRPDTRILGFALKCARDPGWRAQGEFLSRFLRISQVAPFVFSAIAKLIKCEAPYAGTGHAARFRLKNVGKRTLQVMTRTTEVPYRAQEGRASAGVQGFCESPTYELKIDHANVEPGQSLLLDWHFGVAALLGFSGQAWDAALWSESASVPDRSELVETSYKIAVIDPVDGQLHVVQSDKWDEGDQAEPWVPSDDDLEGVSVPTITAPATSDPFAMAGQVDRLEPGVDAPVTAKPSRRRAS